jgi:uncharacterized protein
MDIIEHMSQQKIIDAVEAYIKDRLKNETNGRDWWHVYRVQQMSRRIGEQEQHANMFVVELAALLHDLAHWQLSDGDETHGPYQVEAFLCSLSVQQSTINHILQIIRDTKYKGAANKPQLTSIESKIVYDADKLDSLGAMGIAKTFSYGGSTNRPLHNPGVKPTLHQTFEAYRYGDSTSINHFYEKNLLLKDWMQTKTGKAIAVRRHTFLEQYLQEFYAEWEGKA